MENQSTYRRRTLTSYEPMFKFIMVGDSATGKSSLLIRYTKDIFQEEYTVTIGIEFAVKKIQVDDNYSVKLQIWDTAGQQSFKSIVKSFYRNSAVVMLVFNLTKKQTFHSLKSWLYEARENSPKTTIFVLIGTHLDQEKNREVSRQTAQQWMKEEDIAFYFQTSSKTNVNVAQAFEEVAKQIFMNALGKHKQHQTEPQLKVPHPLEIDKKRNSKMSCC